MNILVFVLSDLIAHYLHFFQNTIFIQPVFPHESQTCRFSPSSPLAVNYAWSTCFLKIISFCQAKDTEISHVI